MRHYSETPLQLDIRTGQFGILTKPSGDVRTTGFILLNSGLLHRVGPYRLGVELARALAKAGFATLRVDQSGRGDSPARPRISAEQAVAADVTMATEHLATLGVQKVVVGGLCSGADDALLVAPNVQNLAGLLLFDGYAPRTMKYYLRRYIPKLFKLKTYQNRIRRSVTNGVSTNIGLDESFRLWDPRDVMIKKLNALLDGEVALFTLFTQDADEVYYYDSQLNDALGNPKSDELLTEVFRPQATHLLPISEHRIEILNLVEKWATAHFPEFKTK